MSETRHHEPSILPTTRTGWFSLAALGLGMAGIGIILASMGLGLTERLGQPGSALLVVAHPITSAGAGLACIVLGLVAVARDHDRSIVMLAVLGWGALAAAVIAAELLLPH
jgi:hypothetical protein